MKAARAPAGADRLITQPPVAELLEMDRECRERSNAENTPIDCAAPVQPVAREVVTHHALRLTADSS